MTEETKTRCTLCQYFSKNHSDTDEEKCGHYRRNGKLWDIWDIGAPCPFFKFHKVAWSDRPYVLEEDKSDLLEGFHSRRD